MTNYNFRVIEQKWQKQWDEEKVAASSSFADGKPKMYILEMFPYPSGRIHMGHLRNYAMGDVLARYYKAKGYNLLHPMGWDAFGLPAENAAMQHGSHPRQWTEDNTRTMRSQLQSIGLFYDWSREVMTCSPEYYRHQQKLFIDFYHANLVYQKEAHVNWDPVENTVLANEQVIEGRGWRSGALVEQRLLRQWFLKTTAFAEELVEDLKKLESWPKRVVTMQENWIGRSEGAMITFECKEPHQNKIEVFTTRPETLFGASFLALSVDHVFIKELAEKSEALKIFIKEVKAHSTAQEAIDTAEKKGFFTGVYAYNPVEPSQLLPIYAANFVLNDYGTGALFGCPAHDQRDFDFAQKYSLSIKAVVQPSSEEDFKEAGMTRPYTGEGMMVNSGFLNGLSTAQAKIKIIQWLKTNQKGEGRTTYRLRDWGVSRQRYWGCPIPMVYCKSCGVLPVKLEDLPVMLPEDVKFQGGNPLEQHPTWKNTCCPKCEGPAHRETDTLDTFFDSSWYFLRFCSPHATQPFDEEAVRYWMPVDKYIGGIEHAILHLLYARFFSKALQKCGYAVPSEPFTSLMTQGMVCHETFKDETGAWLFPEEVERDNNGNWRKKSDSSAVQLGRSEKMSKSKKNVVDPDKIIQLYGADSARLFVLSDTPPEKDISWTEEGIEGAWRFLNRLWRFISKYAEHVALSGTVTAKLTEGEKEIFYHTNQAAFLVSQAFENNQFNVAIAHLRSFSGYLIGFNIDQGVTPAYQQAVETFIKLLFPITPHLCCELWKVIGKPNSLIEEEWPAYNEALLKKDIISLAVQVNGKLRSQIEVPAATEKDMLEKMALALPEVQKHLAGRSVKKIIIIPERVINVVG